MRAFLTLILSIGVLTNVCTGGVFALVTSAADHVAFVQDDIGPMSYGSIGVLSCKKSEDSHAEFGSVDVGGCGDSEECITQLGALTHDELTITVGVEDDVSPQEHLLSFFEVDPAPSMVLARAGPLYEEAICLSHCLLKRE